MQKTGFEPTTNGKPHDLVNMCAFAYQVKLGRGGLNGLLPEVPGFEKLPTELLEGDGTESDAIYTQIAEELALETWPDALFVKAVGGFNPGRRSLLAIRRIAENVHGRSVLKALHDLWRAVGHCDHPTSDETKLLAIRICDRDGSTGIGNELEKRVGGDWIPCSESMPENEENVLVFIPGLGTRVGFKTWQQGRNPDCWIVDGARHELKDITHWMPKPRPPAGLKDRDPQS